MTKEIKKERVSRLINGFFNSATPLDANIIKNQIYTELLSLPYPEDDWMMVKYAIEKGSIPIDQYLKLWETGHSENQYKSATCKALKGFINLLDFSFSGE